jgi:phage repressor protein C with HTH and peptisase S24 domain
MEPRYYEGELLYVNPNKPPSEGDFVIVECTDGSGWIKRLVKMTPTEVVLEQLNPKETRSIPRDEVKNVFRVVGTEDR